MTQTEKNSISDQILERLPIVSLLWAYPAIAAPRDLVEVKFEFENEIPKEFRPTLELLSLDGDLCFSTTIEPAKRNVTFFVPATMLKGEYELLLTFGDYILDSTPFEVADIKYASQAKAFTRGMELSVDALNAVKDGNYDSALQLNKKASKFFLDAGTPEIAIKSWNELGEAFKAFERFEEAKVAFSRASIRSMFELGITGPVRKSREELKESILTNERFLQFMDTYSKKRDLPTHEVRRKAEAYIEEIAANYKPTFMKIVLAVVGWILRTLFEGFNINDEVLNKVKNLSQKGPLILIPYYKRHIDHLILDYLLYNNKISVPLTAAGKNLSFWPVGPLFRSGGAFFIRRSFRGAVLYSKVFAEYIHKLLEGGYNIKQFIEGGQIRTGKLLMPKLGLLSILLNAYKNGACEDITVVPIYIGYDKVLEEKSYLHELGGGQKETETLGQVIKARKFFKKRYGKIYIQINDPISVNELLEKSDIPLAQMKPKEQNAFCRNLGHRVINAINRSVVVTPYELVASAILNCSKEKFSYGQIMSISETYMKYLTAQEAKLADTLVLDHVRAIENALDGFVQSKFIEPIFEDKDISHSERDYLVSASKRPSLEYYKNNCIAFFIPAAYTAMAILEKDTFRFSASDLHARYAFWQDFFKHEFAYDVDHGADFNVRKNIKAFIDDSIVIPHQTLPDTYDVTPAGFRKLKLFSFFLKTYFESYWIVLNYFMRHPQSSVKSKDRIERIAAIGNRMYKRKEVERKEALSKVNYQNAVDLFSARGIKGSDKTEKIEIYAVAIQKALKHLQP